jgi:hypothetical protein
VRNLLSTSKKYIFLGSDNFSDQNVRKFSCRKEMLAESSQVIHLPRRCKGDITDFLLSILLIISLPLFMECRFSW